MRAAVTVSCVSRGIRSLRPSCSATGRGPCAQRQPPSSSLKHPRSSTSSSVLFAMWPKRCQPRRPRVAHGWWTGCSSVPGPLWRPFFACRNAWRLGNPENAPAEEEGVPRVGSDLRATQNRADHKLLRGGSTTAASVGRFRPAPMASLSISATRAITPLPTTKPRRYPSSFWRRRHRLVALRGGNLRSCSNCRSRSPERLPRRTRSPFLCRALSTSLTPTSLHRQKGASSSFRRRGNWLG